jgi:hypothetical protein
MAKEINTEIIINATPEKVWKLLTDFDNYPSWNPFIVSIKGKPEPGQKLEATFQSAPGSQMSFRPKVLVAEPQKRLQWIGRLLFPGLFDGKHSFELIANSNGTTTFRQYEVFTGILVPLFSKSLDTNTANGFNAMNRKLRELAERA